MTSFSESWARPFWRGVRLAFFDLLFFGGLLALFLAGGGNIEIPSIAITRLLPGGRIAPFFDPSVQRWAPYIVMWANNEGVDPNAIATIMQIESCGDPTAVSRDLQGNIVGAMSLMQVMPFHFGSDEDGMDPNVNGPKGTAYFAERLAASGGDHVSAFAQYNGGPRAASPANRVAETRRYVYWAEGIYEDAKAGKTSSSRLSEWMGAGGHSLCAAAAKAPGPQEYWLPPVELNFEWPRWVTVLLEQRRIVDDTPGAHMPYGPDTPFKMTQGLHAGPWGRDYAAACGSPLYAPFTGYVDSIGFDGYIGPYGSNNSFVWFNNGNGTRVMYMHGRYLVERDQRVTKGQLIGYEDSIGNSTGCHTHLAVEVNGQPLDPAIYFGRPQDRW